MPEHPGRVALRAPNWIGDVVLSLPAVRDARRNFPGARLEVVARPWVAPLYGAVAEVDAVRECATPAAEVAALRDGFELALLLPNSFATAWAAYRAEVPERWGYATDGRGRLLTRCATVRRDLRGANQVFYYRALLAGLGLEVSAAPDAHLAPPPAWGEAARARLGEERWVGLNPGAFFGSAKRWIPERYAAVAERLVRRHGRRVAILGGPGERPLADAIAAATAVPVTVLCGETTLAELVGVLSRLDLLVSGDSGPMHLAAAVGCPVVAIVGPTDWRETAPYASRVHAVRTPVACAPCLLRECPIDHRCMTGIAIAHVEEAVADALGPAAA